MSLIINYFCVMVNKKLYSNFYYEHIKIILNNNKIEFILFHVLQKEYILLQYIKK